MNYTYRKEDYEVNTLMFFFLSRGASSNRSLDLANRIHRRRRGKGER